jgi:hypothetical protein
MLWGRDWGGGTSPLVGVYQPSHGAIGPWEYRVVFGGVYGVEKETCGEYMGWCRCRRYTSANGMGGMRRIVTAIFNYADVDLSSILSLLDRVFDLSRKYFTNMDRQSHHHHSSPRQPTCTAHSLPVPLLMAIPTLQLTLLRRPFGICPSRIFDAQRHLTFKERAGFPPTHRRYGLPHHHFHPFVRDHDLGFCGDEFGA